VAWWKPCLAEYIDELAISMLTGDRMRNRSIANTIIVIVIATMVFSGLVDAKMPQMGDYVRATSASSIGLFSVDGVVTDIGNGFICLNSNHAEVNTSENGSPTALWTTSRDVCIGIGTIIQLLWPSKTKMRRL
jgi:hypothetical protein